MLMIDLGYLRSKAQYGAVHRIIHDHEQECPKSLHPPNACVDMDICHDMYIV